MARCILLIGQGAGVSSGGAAEGRDKEDAPGIILSPMTCGIRAPPVRSRTLLSEPDNPRRECFPARQSGVPLCLPRGGEDQALLAGSVTWRDVSEARRTVAGDT
ncbi:hypothetical protein E2C01_067418 [Portunus trituberculatus]|uniref:Uncharacterized protein n=1 Tax=Portunus trituberculatus TaxID=210409 RepID=A0A5B7HTK0_PORTR|nr:hypothetical protein [Portunus trituberculatus]